MKLDSTVLALDLAPVAVTAALHSVGTGVIVVQRPRMFGFVARRRKLFRGQVVLTIILIELLISHMIEIVVWGLWLRFLGLFSDFGSSLYFARISYTTLGYSAPLCLSKT